MSKFEFGLNPIWLLPCAMIALGFSLFLYFRYKSIWDAKWNLYLGISRFLGVFALLFLLINPLWRQIENQIVKPKVQIIVDNSESMLLADKDIQSKVKAAIQKINSSYKDVQLELFDLDKKLQSIDSLQFSQKASNISQTLKNQSNLSAGDHLVATVLITDGIVNQGMGLKDYVSSKPVFVLATGDTNRVNDVFINEIYVNKSTYKGNEFPIQVSVQAKGFKGKNANVTCTIDGEVIAKKNISFSSNNDLQDLSFAYTSKKAGHLKVVCSVDVLTGEKNKVNNSKNRFIQVKDGRKKIALIAAAPHPDLKAIKTSIEKLDKYEVELKIVSSGDKIANYKSYDAFILHQIPTKNTSTEIINQVVESKKPRFIITGLQTDFATFNKINNTVILKGVRGFDQVGGKLNQEFKLFTIEDLDFGFVQHSGPLKVPYAEYDLKAGTEVIFEQTIGVSSNKKPLIAYNNQSVKEIVFFREGIWQWKLFEHLENGNTLNFDLLMSKVLGLIDGNELDTQFEVSSQKESYLESEKPSFSISVKNEIGELVYDQPIDLIIKRNDTVVLKSNFKVSAQDPFYKINNLKEGLYTYFASTKVGTKVLKDAGSFSVIDLKLESKDLKADFNTLRALSVNSKGGFEYLAAFDEKALLEKLKNYPDMIISQEQERNFNEIPYILLLILLLFSIEWFARKLLGDV